MVWAEVRAAFPDQWLLLEAIEAHSVPGRRVIEQIAVLEKIEDDRAIFRRYREVRKKLPGREIFFFHTKNEEILIEEHLQLSPRW
jgi:hypothetical protein